MECKTYRILNSKNLGLWFFFTKIDPIWTPALHLLIFSSNLVKEKSAEVFEEKHISGVSETALLKFLVHVRYLKKNVAFNSIGVYAFIIFIFVKTASLKKRQKA